jgi:hypothetical protein
MNLLDFEKNTGLTGQEMGGRADWPVDPFKDSFEEQYGEVDECFPETERYIS